jgi:RHS repeat-associated protein
VTLLALGLPAPVAAQTGTRVEYYHLDALGSVRVVTNASGQVVRRHDFGPFGEEVAPSYPSPERKLFTGQERDAETGLDYFGARYYRADIGRFTTIDPVYTWTENLVDPQRWNRYTYVRNNPLRYLDPDGREVVQMVVETHLGRRITFVDSRVEQAFRAFVEDARQDGIKFTFNNVFRTQADQDAINTVNTRNTSGTSPHLVGLAFDVNISALSAEDRDKLVALAAQHGFLRLANPANDPPHFQALEFITRTLSGQPDSDYMLMLAENQRHARFLSALNDLSLSGLPK